QLCSCLLCEGGCVPSLSFQSSCAVCNCSSPPPAFCICEKSFSSLCMTCGQGRTDHWGQ
ncbi:unnamed protein product, partial [Staurois parvus]